MLYYEKPFTVVFQELLSWINDTINEIQGNCESRYFPGMHSIVLVIVVLKCLYTVLVAHNGFAFDYRILTAEVEHRNLRHELHDNLMFADTLFDCIQYVP